MWKGICEAKRNHHKFIVVMVGSESSFLKVIKTYFDLMVSRPQIQLREKLSIFQFIQQFLFDMDREFVLDSGSINFL